MTIEELGMFFMIAINACLLIILVLFIVYLIKLIFRK